MNYAEALAYIEQLNSRGIALGLERIKTLLNLLGNPQEDVRCIHVAGTNGKGSVCALIDSALQQAGLRVGRYISPTLYEYLERFQINGAYMAEQDFADILTTVRQACVQMAQQNLEQPTVFEVETAVAFLYFQQQQCDYVLLEVGMGGRLDSTNVIACPALSVITSIGMDHTGMLGNTLGEIAAEKAGIIKQGCPVVLAPQQAEAMNVLLDVCKVCGVVPVVADDTQICNRRWGVTEQTFSYKLWHDISIGLLGAYQQVNAAVALEALQVIRQWEPALTDNIILEGLAQAKWSGRFEIIGTEPLFIVDGAHNPAGAQALADTVQQLMKQMTETQREQTNLWLLMGVFRDKEYETIGRIMSSCGNGANNRLIVFRPQTERGLEAESLAEAMQLYYKQVVTVQTAEEAVYYALQYAARQDIVISFGSLSTIKEVQDTVNTWEVQQNEYRAIE